MDFVTITDVVEYESQDPVLTQAAMALGEQCAESIDELARDVLAAGTTVQYADNRASRGYILASSLPTANEIREAVATLGDNNAKKITKIVNPDSGFNTSPINAAYIAITDAKSIYTYKGLTGWVPIQEYAQKADIMDGEVGALDDVRFIQTSKAKYWPAATASAIVDVHSTLIFGKDAYGVSRISGKAVQNIIKPLGSGGTADPLNQRATSGWKATFVAKILDDTAMLRLEHSVAI
jgi:N4-gp56 family major capsid protein